MATTTTTTSGDFRGYYGEAAARRAEEAELKAAAAAQPMPTSLEGFKRHPTFVLDRHLGAVLGLELGAWI